jgi:hypothetical protein
MKVEIEISEKVLNLVVAQCMAMADSYQTIYLTNKFLILTEKISQIS